MDHLTPRPSQVIDRFNTLYAESAIAATDWYYQFSQDTNYIRRDRITQVIISHCHNLALAQKLQSRIQEHWNNAEVQILPTRGLCSYYAERGGLIVSY